MAVYGKRGFGVMFAVLKCLAVKLGQRRKGRRPAADDRECHRQAEGAGPDDGVRRTAYGDPDREPAAFLARIDGDVVQRWAKLAVPGDGLVFAQLQQQIELLREKLVVVGQGVAEQREGFGERAPADHQLGSSTR